MLSCANLASDRKRYKGRWNKGVNLKTKKQVLHYVYPPLGLSLTVILIVSFLTGVCVKIASMYICNIISAQENASVYIYEKQKTHIEKAY